MKKVHNYIDPDGIEKGFPYNVYLSSGRLHSKIIYRANGEWNGRPILIFMTFDTHRRVEINPAYIESIEEVEFAENEGLYGTVGEEYYDDFDDEKAKKGNHGNN